MGSVMMSFSPSNLARTPSGSQLSGRRRSFLNLVHRRPLAGLSPVARSTPWLSTCTLTWSLRNPGRVISTTSCSSPASFHSTDGSKSSNSLAVPRRRSMAGRSVCSPETTSGTATKLLAARAYTDSDTPLSCLYILRGEEFHGAACVRERHAWW